jgi:hypothetical protein
MSDYAKRAPAADVAMTVSYCHPEIFVKGYSPGTGEGRMREIVPEINR